jgi:soluble lytic murein transglycosylase
MHALPRRAGRALALALLVWLTACALLPTPDARPGLPALPPTAQLQGQSAAELLALGLETRQQGDYDGAALAFQALLATHPQAEEAPAARYFLAESYALRRRWASAARAFEVALVQGLAPAQQARGLFLLGRSYEEQGQAPEALAAFERYRAGGGPLEPYAAKRQAALHQARGALAAAADGFVHAARSDIARGERAVSYEAAIQAHRQLGQPDTALSLYQELLAFAELPDYRARILLEAAALASQQGQAELARAWHTQILTATPQAAQAPEALAALEADPQAKLDPALAATVLLAHGRPAESLPHFAVALANQPDAEARLALSLERALALRATGELAGAAEALAAIASEAPESEAGRRAAFERAETNALGGSTDLAVELLLAFAARYPDDEQAPSALARAAELREAAGKAEAAAQMRRELAQRYAASAAGQAALATLARTAQAQGDLAGALAAWRQRGEAASGAARAESYFFAAQVASREPAASSVTKELAGLAARAAPDSYWGVRAAELGGLLIPGEAPLGTPPQGDEWQAVEHWLTGWAGATLSATLRARADPAVQRAVELRAVGLTAEAALEWREARERHANNAGGLYGLVRAALDDDDPYAAVEAATALAALARERGAPEAPLALRRVLFPTPYAPQVLAAGRAHGVDPLLLYAMLRQESLFNPQATSWVGARGLAQVMPETGAGIARKLGVSPFHPDDLYQPSLSIRFGAYYLGAQIAALDSSIHAGLAAYNGGPGNATRWAGGSHVADPEAFVGMIDFPETQHYVMAVYAFYGSYRRIYYNPES